MCTFNKTVVCAGVWVYNGQWSRPLRTRFWKSTLKMAVNNNKVFRLQYKTGQRTTGVLKN